MRAWKALDKLENPAAAKAWLFTILRRELARHLSKQKFDTVSLDMLLDSEQLALESSEIGKIEHWVLQRALKEMSHDYLEPLLLQVIAGYSCEEIADILSMKTGAVMTRVYRARQQLRQYLTNDALSKKRVTS